MVLLQLLPIPEWKWEVISMDFITGLPKSKNQNDSIFVVIDKLSKEAHFIHVKSTYKAVNIVDIFLKDIFRLHGIPKAIILTYKAVNIVDIFLKEIFRLHGIPKEIISDWDVKFTWNLWRYLFSRLEVQLRFSTAYNPQMDGKIERLNQIIEDMLQMYVMNSPTKWDDYLHLTYFAYNNGY